MENKNRIFQIEWFVDYDAESDTIDVVNSNRITTESLGRIDSGASHRYPSQKRTVL